MMLPTHLAATLLLGLLAARLVEWDGRSWFLALLAGVAIDVDHFFEVPAYLATELPRQGLAALTPAALLAHGGGWTSFFHRPEGCAVIVAVSLAYESWVPVAAWSLHQSLDALVGYNYVAFAGPTEWAILAVLVALVLVLGRAHLAARWPGLTIRGAGALARRTLLHRA